MKELKELSSGTEDDTFNRLRRDPFEVADIAWRKTLNSGGSVQAAIEELKKTGWKQHEYYKERFKRDH